MTISIKWQLCEFYFFLSWVETLKRQKTDHGKQQRLDTFFAQQHDWEKSVTENVATIGSIDDHVTTCIISTPTPTPVPSSSSAGSEEITHLTESDPGYLCRKNLSE